MEPYVNKGRDIRLSINDFTKLYGLLSATLKRIMEGKIIFHKIKNEYFYPEYNTPKALKGIA